MIDEGIPYSAEVVENPQGVAGEDRFLIIDDYMTTELSDTGAAYGILETDGSRRGSPNHNNTQSPLTESIEQNLSYEQAKAAMTVSIQEDLTPMIKLNQDDNNKQ